MTSTLNKTRLKSLSTRGAYPCVICSVRNQTELICCVSSIKKSTKSQNHKSQVRWQYRNTSSCKFLESRVMHLLFIQKSALLTPAPSICIQLTNLFSLVLQMPSTVVFKGRSPEGLLQEATNFASQQTLNYEKS